MNRHRCATLILSASLAAAAASAGTAPTVTTTAASSITGTSATLGGNASADGGAAITERGVVYSSTDVTPTMAEPGVTKNANGSGTGVFSETIGSLSPATTYYFQAYAINSLGTSYGNAQSFTTLAIPATVTTQAVSSILAMTATGNGNVTSLGVPNPTQHGVCWNTSGTPTTGDSKTEEGPVGATGTFTSGITGLSPDTTYYVRAYATNTAGTTYGMQVSFTTNPVPPTVTTQAVTSISATTATGNGNVTDLGVPNPTQHGVCWNTSGAPTVGDDRTEEGPVVATGAFTSGMTGLSANTTYYCRAYVTNTAGTTYGAEVSFTTEPVPATVTTQMVTSVGTTTASGNGNVTSLGVPNPTQHGVCWNTSGTPTTGDSKTEEGMVSATGAFTSNMTGLSPNTTYYCRAYATNTAGTTYGTEVSFTTNPAPPTVTTQAASSISTTTATGNGSIVDLGSFDPTQHGVCWNTSGGPTVADAKTEEGPVAATGAFTSGITGLSAGTTYHYRAYATNSVGTSYGADQTFTTLDTYAISYDGNGATAGTPPAGQVKVEGVDIALAANSGGLEKPPFVFAGWNTAPDGSGTHYAEGATYAVDAALTLHAKWVSVSVGSDDGCAAGNGTGAGLPGSVVTMLLFGLLALSKRRRTTSDRRNAA